MELNDFTLMESPSSDLMLLQVIKRYESNRKSPAESINTPYKYNDTHFYSKITFFWLNPFLHRGYEAPLEENDFGEIPENERSRKDYYEFLKIFSKQEVS